MNQRSSEQTTPDSSTVIDVMRGWVSRQPENDLFTFLDDTDAEGAGAAHLSYGQLDRRARALAARLQAMGLAGERALLIYPPGLEFVEGFLGCLYAGVVAVPAAPGRASRAMSRLRGIAADARPSVVLTTSAKRSEPSDWLAQVPELSALPVLGGAEVADEQADDWRPPELERENLAFLQYTSGSTAEPKGVMISHGNLLHNSAIIQELFGTDSESRGVFWLPWYHDMGLIGGVLQTLYCGGQSTLMAPSAFLQRPLRWLETISRTGAIISGGPNFAFDLCARKATPERIAGLDLSRWRVAFNGAEPVRAETIDHFTEAFAPCGFRREAFLPCYGMAETTLLVTGGPWQAPPVVVAVGASMREQNRIEIGHGEKEPTKWLVGCGRVAGGLEVIVVDPESGERRPEGHVGEIWVAGPSVARGYWGCPEATERTFGARTADGSGPYLRTGDLGAFHKGELLVTGRLKDLILIRGRNVYPQDIERTVQQCHADLIVEGGAAFAVEVEGAERLVVVQEVDRKVDREQADALIGAIRQAVAEEQELDVHAVCLIRMLSLPKTSSGKVRRQACREAFLAGTLKVVAQSVLDFEGGSSGVAGAIEDGERAGRSELEIRHWITARLAVLLRVSPAEIDTQREFAAFGMGSLQAARLAGELEEWLGRPLAPTLAYEYPTIASLARHLAGTTEAEAGAGSRVVGPEPPDEPIAVIGIGCRFPGADGPEAYWSLLCDGLETVGEVPADRWSDDGEERPLANLRGSRWGGFLEGVDRFDADFFGISAGRPRGSTRSIGSCWKPPGRRSRMRGRRRNVWREGRWASSSGSRRTTTGGCTWVGRFRVMFMP